MGAYVAENQVNITHLTPTIIGPMLVMKEVNGERVVVLQISHQDLKFLELALEDRNTSYSTPHDTMGNIIAAFDGVIERVVIDEPEIREPGSDEFVATVYIKRNGQLKAIGARKVDAIALALKTNSSVFVEDAVFEKSLILSQESPVTAVQRKNVFAWFDTLNHQLLTKH